MALSPQQQQQQQQQDISRIRHAEKRECHMGNNLYDDVTSVVREKCNWFIFGSKETRLWLKLVEHLQQLEEEIRASDRKGI
ncbi:hypothetical protein CHS0354_028191 [Potamilus streckersoni]|uniref:Uncharacterized protein n=1 Tax=Potamilus streckersoni TaxID=2493646 RepID=A0AAE0TI68_9BIVA|nr:hypothetical protein CHS0354_028191 [Potamilus streckersoni]